MGEEQLKPGCMLSRALLLCRQPFFEAEGSGGESAAEKPLGDRRPNGQTGAVMRAAAAVPGSLPHFVFRVCFVWTLFKLKLYVCILGYSAGS